MKKFNLKKTAAVILAAAITAASSGVSAQEDITAVLEKLSRLEIMNGYEDGNFYPERLLTRAEMTQILLNLEIPDIKSVLSEADISKLKRYHDVPENHWAAKAIGLSEQYPFLLDYMDGFPNRTYKPDNNMTYAEVIKILVDILGYKPFAEVSFGGYPDGYLSEANFLEITNGIEFNPNANVTRGDTAIMIYNMLNVRLLLTEVLPDGKVAHYVDGYLTFEKYRYGETED